jgi:hypothetical protein
VELQEEADSRKIKSKALDILYKINNLKLNRYRHSGI